ncbi:MAG: contractile injection system tape measure protein [Kordia sp.]|uniref:contractile injection system tape measure protein n=1 Tax=Kordia sp. TaxID=1965332 RepID=UPI00385F374D
MHSQGAHIVTRCQWNTAFDSKRLAHQLQTDISAWSAYKMKRVITSVFDSICPKGQTLKIKKLAVDLGTITYENMLSELPLRLEEALRIALYDLIMYPKNGDKTLEIVHEDIAQVHVLRDFLMQGMLPWNYQETYGTAVQIMRSQLTNNRLDVIQMIQEIGSSANVRKRIAWQFPDVIIKKIIAGLEPNNHQQIINFSDEFVKVQEKETIVQTSTNDLKKNIWLWILNYLFTERGTIFNRISFVRSTVTQMASHFNLSYDVMIELIEKSIERANEYSPIEKGFIAILKLLSDELQNTSFSRVKTEKQKENFWVKVATYFNSETARSTNIQKNEFNELVINLSKLDTARFQKILLNIDQKPSTWKAVLKDLIPAAIENLFLALAPTQSKNVLTQISFLSKLPQTTHVKVQTLDLYTYGIEFCINNQNTSVAKNAFLDFVVEKLAKQQQQTKLVILDHFVLSNVTNTQKKTSFISLFKELNTLYQKEITNTKMVASNEALQQIMSRYISEIEQTSNATNASKELEKTVQKWISASPVQFWKVVQKLEKTPKVTVHITALVSAYGMDRFLKSVQPESYTLLLKIQKIIHTFISKQPKKANALRAIEKIIISTGFEVIWKDSKIQTTEFFVQFLQQLQRQESSIRVSKTDIQAVIELLLQTSKIRTLAWSARKFASIQKHYNIQLAKTPIEEVIALIQQSNQQVYVAEYISKLVRTKKHTTREFKTKETTLISYLIANGVHIRTRLRSMFLKQITATNTTISNTQIELQLEEIFWQSLVMYQVHRGNEARFISLFEKTVIYTFPALEMKPQKAVKSVVEMKKVAEKNQLLQTPYRISTVVLFETIRTNFTATNSEVQIVEKSYSFAALFMMALETSPTEIRAIIKETTFATKQLHFIQETINLETFLLLNANDASSTQSEVFKSIYTLFTIAKQLGNAQITTTLQGVFWKEVLAFIQGKITRKRVVEKLTATTFDALSEIATLDQITIVKHVQNNAIVIPKLLKTVLVARHRIFELISEHTQNSSLSTAIKAYIETEKAALLSEYLITHYEIPAWFLHKEAYSYERVVNELIAQKPLLVLKTIRSQKISEIQLLKFAQTVHFETLIAALLKVNTAQQKELLDMRMLYENIPFVSMRGISTKSLQEIIIQKVVTAWRTSNWTLIASNTIWNELLWETCGKKAVQQRDFIKAIGAIKTQLPTALLVTYKTLLPHYKTTKKTTAEIISKTENKTAMNTELASFPDEGVPIPNAGLVMLNTYFLMLLDRLGIVKDKEFISENAQLDAIHYLQYIVTGLTETEESLLTLNKILVGLPPNVPVKSSIEMTDEQKQLIDGMIQAAIHHWTAIGDTSINGFRGNWLVREGILRETEDRWELTVEKRAYDILMLKSPFSFSIIKLPWMEKPLHVTWPF